MKVAYIQFEPVIDGIETNMTKLKALFERARGADLVVLPELCNSGYNFTSHEQAYRNSEYVEGSVFLKFIQNCCESLKAYTVVGFNERADKGLFNSAVLVGPDGVVGVYRKLHLFRDENRWFLPGDSGLPVFDTPLCRVGMLVCFDWFFSEAWRVLALKKADIVCHSANLVIPKLAQRGIPYNAISNRIFIVTANRVGVEGELTFTGRSIIVNTRGEVLFEGPESGEDVQVCEIDINDARNKQVNSFNNLLGDRRTEEYSYILKNWEETFDA